MPSLAWITGAGGLIGSHLLKSASRYAPSWEVVGVHFRQLQRSAQDDLQRRFDSERPDLVLHCAALSRSADCENQPRLAHEVNVELTARLAQLARKVSFVLLSTDLVFDGSLGWYKETDPVGPLGVYARTKQLAEQCVLVNQAHTVVRTSLNYGISPTGDRAFNEVMCREWELGRTTRLFQDEFRCPIPAAVTARAVWELVQRGRPGLYHLAGSQKLSRWDIGQLLAQQHPRLQPQITACSLREYRGAPRAPDTSLDCSRIQSMLSFPLPGFREYLKNPDSGASSCGA